MHPPTSTPLGGLGRTLLRPIGLTVLTLLAIAVAGSWLLAVYFLPGRLLLNDAQLDTQQERASQMSSIGVLLARSVSLNPHVDMLALYATPEYFEVARKQSRSISYDPAVDYVFLVNEDTHMDDLPLVPTPVRLHLDDGRVVEPAQLEMLTYSIHHKVSVATFPRSVVDAGGVPSQVSLVAPAVVMDAGVHIYDPEQPIAVSWSLPIDYPPELLDPAPMPFGRMLALAMGLLATVMTPCLIQLLVYYLSTLTGMSAEALEGGRIEPSVRRRLMETALGFVAGYALLFTVAGALAGWAGETLQNAFNLWTRPLAIGAGVVMVALGLWMAVRTRAPIVCRLPLIRNASVQQGAKRLNLLQSTLMGLSFAVGCSTCFGGALIATLLLYVGTIGSPLQGAAILFFFSLGVGIPFLVAAAMLTRVMPALQRIHRILPTIGLVSSLVVVGFGVLLITDRFHLVSTWIAPILGVG